MNPIIALALRGLPTFTPIGFIIGLIIILLICGMLAWMLQSPKAPIAEPWKDWIQWCLIAVPIVWVILFLLTFFP